MSWSALQPCTPPVGIETFDEPHEWVSGGGPGGVGASPVPVQLGGQGGASDPYLLVQSTGGSGPGSRLSAQNLGVWAGYYTSAGITEILADAINFGPEDVSLRVLLVQFGAMGVNAAITSEVLLMAGGGWQDIAFDISPGALIAAAPGTDVNVLLANVHEVRFFHNPDEFFIPGQNPPVAAALGLDNLQPGGATVVPEPTVLGLLLTALALRGLRRGKH